MGTTTPDWLVLPEDQFQEGYPPTRKSSSGYLHRVLVRALRESVATVPGDGELKRKPLVLELKSPLPPRLRFYLYQATQHPSERQQGTYKIQLTSGLPAGGTQPARRSVPRQGPKPRLYFDRAENVRPIVMGYVPGWNLFILWDADMHDLGEGFGYGKSCQVRPEIVGKALARGMAQGNRNLHAGLVEKIVVTRPRRLAEALKLRIRLSNDSMAEGLF